MRLFIKNIAVLLILNLFSVLSFSQVINDKNDENIIGSFWEELYLTTDRDIYITGERVWFKVLKLNGLTHAPYDLSKVIYLELIDKNSFPLKQLKIKADAFSSNSGFILPDNISSGNYVIRAYTNWMKNSPSDQFCHKTITVINPFESIDHIPMNSSGKVIEAKTDFSKSKGQISYLIALSKSEYSAREKVHLEITANDMAGNPVESDISVSVAKTALVNYSGNISSIGSGSGNRNQLTVPSYLPELEDHLITGKIMMKETDEPIRKIDISLSWVGKVAGCQFSKTDENGEFRFVMNETGLKEIVIQPLSSDLTGYYIELDQPFYNKSSAYRTEEFYLDSNKIEDINNVIVSMQINNVYEEFLIRPTGEGSKIRQDFYGTPENSVKMSDYIELSSVREVVKEIIPNVYTLRQNGKYDFKLINKFRGQPFENKPLVLVDGVPINDFEKVLNISSKEIERADITNTRYFYSGNVFDGILSFVTNKGNLSSLEFDNSIFRQVYDTYNNINGFYSPDYSTESMRESRIPDFRNTLLWSPDLKTGKDGKAVIEFFTSDESTEYTILVEGISSDGKAGFSTTFLIVK